MYIRIALLCLLTTCIANSVFSQKVGVVLSGGGSWGMAHIGALKALEEAGIPIDCITGTSAGALVGSFYAAGYSPVQIEAVTKRMANRWLAPGLALQEKYFFEQGRADNTFIEIPLFNKRLSSSLFPEFLISDVEINIGLNMYLAGANGAARGNFDSLFVPFRAVSSDIVNQKSVVLKSGSLAFAVRSSTAVPLFFSAAANEEHQALFDGGIYDNFPVGPMVKDFAPDFIIGISVNGAIGSAQSEAEQRGFLMALVSNHLIDRESWEKMPVNGMFIVPELGNLSVTDFSPEGIEKAIRAGYEATQRCIGDIKENIQRQQDSISLVNKRKAFRSRYPVPVIKKVSVMGLSEWEKKYVAQLINTDRKAHNFEDLRRVYYRLKADAQLEYVFPELLYREDLNGYEARLFIKRAPRMSLRFGGNYFTPTDHQIELTARLKGIGAIGYEGELSLLQGSVVNSASARGMLSLPMKFPVALEINNTVMQWDLQRPVFSLFNTDKSANVSVGSFEFRPALLWSLGSKETITLAWSVLNQRFLYYNNADGRGVEDRNQTDLAGSGFWLGFEQNSLDRKMYAKKGRSLFMQAGYRYAAEKYKPLTPNDNRLNVDHRWFQARTSYRNYYSGLKTVSFGWGFDGAWSTMGASGDLTTARLASPKFEPLVDSPILYIPELYSRLYSAGGLMAIVRWDDNFDFRFEGWYHHSFWRTVQQANGRSGNVYVVEPDLGMVVGSAGVTYQTAIGPIGGFVNYYSLSNSSTVRFFLHVGYVLFPRRSWP